MPSLDLNADLGEGSPHDAELMRLITSANVCCGGHAGSPDLIRQTLELAKQHGVKVGAHPGYADREHFGRRDMALSPIQIRTLLQYQIGGLDAIARGLGIRLSYVKPHGALYNQAMRDPAIAQAACAAVYPWHLPLVGLPNSALEHACLKLNLRFIAEGFSDRRYRPDGSLVPRTEPDSQIDDPATAVQQAKQLLTSGQVQTLCVHGDHPHAVAFAELLREQLTAAGVELRAWS